MLCGDEVEMSEMAGATGGPAGGDHVGSMAAGSFGGLHSGSLADGARRLPHVLQKVAPFCVTVPQAGQKFGIIGLDFRQAVHQMTYLDFEKRKP